MPDREQDAHVFAEHRRVLLGVAYRVLGSFADAEDVVQESWLRWSARPSGEVHDPRGYLVRTTTRLAIDRLRREQTRRETYAGPWLPEPVVTDTDSVELAESVSMAMLVVLETLSPLERAVFVLREAFDFSYAEVAEATGRSETAVRQLAHRAKEHVASRRPRFDADPKARRQVTERFLAACQTADIATFMALLAPDVTLVSDGGGQARSPRRPIFGADKVARFFASTSSYPIPDPGFDIVQIGDGPGIIVTSGGTPITAIVLDLMDGQIANIHLVANPAKLHGLRAAELD
ncbi:MAG TPA: RNA polymerase sigma factor SigJ [Mycobacteriales bacterium]|nr:RNA polymerase sigma factor SigJ [Mycobacteriales bacterium]